MNKKVILFLTTTMLLAFMSFWFSNYIPPFTPIKFARIVTGLNLPKDLKVVTDTNYYNFTGEGYAYLVFSTKGSSMKNILTKDILHDFSKLPIKQDIYGIPNELERYTTNSFAEKVIENVGYYKFTKFSKNESFDFVIIDETNELLIVYRFND